MLLVVYAASQPAVAADLDVENLYDINTILDVSIELPEEDWKTLCKQTRDPGRAFAGEQEDPFTWFRGTITIDGHRIESVGIRKKGFIGSLDDRFPSLKVDFKEFKKQNPIDGIETLTLNNNKQDESLLSQFLAYRLFNAAGIHAPRCNFARVSVNGEYLGVYSNVESITKSYLKRRFDNNDGNLYEGTVTDFYPKTIDKLEAKTNKKNNDRKTIERLSNLLADKGPLDISQVEQIVDIDNFLRYWAVESLIEFWDGYSNNQNNYWTYQDSTNHKMYFMPWGADAAFATMRFVPAFGPPGPVSVYSQGALANRLFHNETIAAKYKDTMRELLKQVWNEDKLLAEIDTLQKRLSSDLHSRQQQMPPAIERLEKFIKTRRDKIERELEAWPVKIADRPRKPTYMVQAGTAKGRFSTLWSNKPVANAADDGTLELNLHLDNKSVPFERLGAAAYKRPEMNFQFGFGGPGQHPKPTADFALAGIREDGKPVRIAIGIEIKTLLENVGKPIDVNGMYIEGQQAGFGFPPMGSKMIRGQMTLTKASVQSGEELQGEFDLQVVEMRGGFFDQFREMGGGRFPPPGTNRPGAPFPGGPAPGTPFPGAPNGSAPSGNQEPPNTTNNETIKD